MPNIRPHHLAISAGVALFLVLCLNFIPRGEESVAMLARDGYSESALAKLEALYASGNRGGYILMQLYVLRLQLGHPREAMAALEEYLAENPTDNQADELLAALYLDLHRTDQAIAIYEKLNRQRPAELRFVKALLGIYRKNRSYEAEFALLRRAPPGALELEDLYRLGEMATAANDLRGAIAALLEADGKAPLREKGSPYEKQFRLTLFSLLIRTGDPGRAVALAAGWCQAWNSSYYIQILTKRLAQTAPTSVLPFAEALAAKIPGSELQVAQALHVAKRPDLLTELLEFWAPRLATAPARFRDFVYLANESGDPALPVRALDALIAGGAKADTIAALAEEVFHQGGISYLFSLNHELPLEALKSKPLFGAYFFYATGNTMLAKELVFSVDPSLLSDSENDLWLQLLDLLMSRRAFFNHLTELRDKGALSSETYAAITARATSQRTDNPSANPLPERVAW